MRLAAAKLPRKPVVFYEIRYPNLLGAGADNLVSTIIAEAGGRNLLADKPGKVLRISAELLMAGNPDIYLYQLGPMNKNPSDPAVRPGFAALGAVKKGMAFAVPEIVFSRPGPRSLETAETLSEIFTRWAGQGAAAPAAPAKAK